MSDPKDIEAGSTHPAGAVHAETMKPGTTPEEAELEYALSNYVPDSAAEKRLVRKLDMVTMPTLWIMYILAYIDRQNIVCWIPHALYSWGTH